MADDPMEEFLARERAALGQDAEQFQSGPTSAVLSPTVSEQASDVAILPTLNPISPSFTSVSSSAFPSSQTSTPAPQAPSPASQALSPPPAQFDQEWQSTHRAEITSRDETSAAKHADTVKEAQRAIDTFYAEYNERKDRAIEENRAQQEIETQAATRGTLWERVGKQIDMATKASSEAQRSQVRDTARMRDLLQDLKRDANSPGVKQKTVI
ncbi:Clathrin light chain [Coemansia sp. RSA 451]|nr:Clathrin light chain [Coemansia sp. RSA 451]KAJ2521703.1 Clathrin light chain [Coemansia sp. RSA 1937]